MTPSQCPVHETLLELQKIPVNRRTLHPRSRRLLEEIATLIQDIVAARAGADHLPSIDALVTEVCAFADDPAGVETGLWLKGVTGYGINAVNGNFSGGDFGSPCGWKCRQICRRRCLRC